jgi:hypothetical protein
MEGRRVLFPAIYKDGELLEKECDVFVDCSLVTVKGELKKQSWDPVSKRFMMMFGLFIGYNGCEYGTLKIRESDFLDECNGVGVCCDGGNGPHFRIHVNEFDIEFV